MELRCGCCNKDVSRVDIYMAFRYELLCKSCYEDKTAKLSLQRGIIEDLQRDIKRREDMIASLFKDGSGDYNKLFNQRYTSDSSLDKYWV
ncbi:hypothetical protein ANTHOS_18 [Bacillus phage Anthos]|uniref:Uncharacterized protein n=1 Tax=Bacillus phage Anthos TaxID=2796502 RepID=A0A7U3T8I7_9CAUD|nr:hypothetical protein ANTHOS_18 [Bacillus phage Anthos]